MGDATRNTGNPTGLETKISYRLRVRAPAGMIPSANFGAD